jgi:hypothetical protein
MAARADAQQAFLDGGDELAAELVSGDAALSAATETDGVWSLNTGDASVGLVLDATAPTEAWGDATLAGWDRPEIAEWVTTTRNGIEHAMLVESPLLPGNEQRLTVLTAGLQPMLLDSSNVVLNNESGLPMIGYGGLFAFDANAQEVPTWFEVVGSDIVIAFDDTDATYPILIDPLATAASKTLGGVAHALGGATSGRGLFGWAVASGDIDDDGYDDVVVGVPRACSSLGCHAAEGVVEVFLGGPNGPATTANFTLDSDIVGAEMGRSLAVADVDGNNCADIVAGAPEGELDGQADEGLVVVFRSRYCDGGTGFYDRQILDSDEASTGLGTSVTVARTRTRTPGVAVPGYIYATGDSTRALWEFKYDSTTGDFSRAKRSFGTAAAPMIVGVVTTVKDADGDGDDEVAVSFPRAFWPAASSPTGSEMNGWVSLFRGLGGQSGGISTTSTFLRCPFPSGSGVVDPACGGSIGSADVNGDGRGDLIVANRNCRVGLTGQQCRKTTDIWQAAANGSFPTAPQKSVAVPGAVNQLGVAVAGLGDLNQDGYEEFASCDASDGAGNCRVYNGSASGNYAQRGVYSVVADDVNHGMITGGVTLKDPFPTGNEGNDVIVGTPNAGSAEGTVRIFNGTPSGPQLLDSTSYSIVTGTTPNQKLGKRVLLSDLNDDGRDDLIVSSPDAQEVRWWIANASGNFDSASSRRVFSGNANDRFGEAIATLKVPGIPGRFIAIGAPGRCGDPLPDGTCRSLPNAGYIQIISIFGPPDWFSDISGSQFGAGAQLGSSLANIGNAYTTADGLAASTRTSAAPVVLFKYNPGARRYNIEDTIDDFCTGGSPLTQPLALAGVDMNHDGTTDVIVGDGGCNPANSVDGVVFGFAGGGDYTSTMFDLKGPGKSTFGYALAGAGDVNRDGRPDLLVGAPTEVNGATAPGAVHLYRGTTSTPTELHVVRGTVHQSRFGESVAGGRDVNFDGYLDFIVGAPNMSTAGGWLRLPRHVERPQAAHRLLRGPGCGTWPLRRAGQRQQRRLRRRRVRCAGRRHPCGSGARGRFPRHLVTDC